MLTAFHDSGPLHHVGNQFLHVYYWRDEKGFLNHLVNACVHAEECPDAIGSQNNVFGRVDGFYVSRGDALGYYLLAFLARLLYASVPLGRAQAVFCIIYFTKLFFYCYLTQKEYFLLQYVQEACRMASIHLNVVELE